MTRFTLALALLLALGARQAAAADLAPFQTDVRAVAIANQDFRRVLFTGAHEQLVVMSLAPGEAIGEESHPVDQCFYFVAGRGEARIAGQARPLKEHDMVCVPAGARHDIRNTGPAPLKLFTLYAPPQHPAGTVHPSKADAQAPHGR